METERKECGKERNEEGMECKRNGVPKEWNDIKNGKKLDVR